MRSGALRRAGSIWTGMAAMRKDWRSGAVAIHVVLAFFALSLVFSWQGPGSGSGGETQDWTAWLLAQPLGRWLVGAIGIAVLGATAGHFVKAWKLTFCRYLRADARTMQL